MWIIPLTPQPFANEYKLLDILDCFLFLIVTFIVIECQCKKLVPLLSSRHSSHYSSSCYRNDNILKRVHYCKSVACSCSAVRSATCDPIKSSTHVCVLVRLIWKTSLIEGITLRPCLSPKIPQEEENKSLPCSILFTGYQCRSRRASTRTRSGTASHFSSAACFLSISAHSITASVPANASSSIALSLSTNCPAGAFLSHIQI